MHQQVVVRITADHREGSLLLVTPSAPGTLTTSGGYRLCGPSDAQATIAGEGE